MDYSYILGTGVPQFDKLKALGFIECKDDFILKKPLLETDFYVVFQLQWSQKKLTAEVFEKETDEKYALFNVGSARGPFVSKIREKVEEELNAIRENGFESTDVKQKYQTFIAERFNCYPDYPWEDDKLNCAVFRCPSGKWFALMMEINFNKIGFQSEEKVWAVNLKADAEKIPELINHISVFPAYHMNKKYWITVLLTSVTDFNQLKELTEISYDLVEKGKKR